MDKEGIIYKITNTVNKKIYIGQTKEKYGNICIGIEGRLKQHLSNAFMESRKNECPKLYNAVRKYGKDKFVIEELIRCKLVERDNIEIEMIKKYDATNRYIGYNISLGGSGRSVANVTEETRDKISKSQRKNGLMNIQEYYCNNEIIGYIVQRKINATQHRKLFASTKNTPEQNLELAKNLLNDLKNNKSTDNKYNKKNNLPRNINYVKDRNTKEVIGYRVDIMINSKKIIKNYQNKRLSLDELLQKAIEYKSNVLEQSKNHQTIGKPIGDNPQPSF